MLYYNCPKGKGGASHLKGKIKISKKFEKKVLTISQSYGTIKTVQEVRVKSALKSKRLAMCETSLADASNL